MEGLNWGLILNVISSLIIAGVFGNIIFHRYRKKSERLKPKREDIDIADITRKSAEEAMEEVAKWHQKVNDLLDNSLEMKKEINELKYQVDENNRKVTGIQSTLKRQIGKKKFAEKNICLVTKCKLREPPLGTFTSEDNGWGRKKQIAVKYETGNI